VKVFILAHQDDEVFLLPYILNSEKKLFIYLTNGVSAESSVFKLEIRTTEAAYVFKKYLAELNSEVNWWGLENSVPEGELHKFVNIENLASIEAVIKDSGERVTQILTTTFEGAHQDHDAAAVITRKLAMEFSASTIEVSTYPQWFSRLYSFKVLNPRYPSQSFHFGRLRTLQLALRLMASYKSQRVTWIGLGPATLGAYTFRKYRTSTPQPVRMVTPCFYEFRGRAFQIEVLRYLTSNT
jgi:hypothetical protein